MNFFEKGTYTCVCCGHELFECVPSFISINVFKPTKALIYSSLGNKGHVYIHAHWVETKYIN